LATIAKEKLVAKLAAMPVWQSDNEIVAVRVVVEAGSKISVPRLLELQWPLALEERWGGGGGINREWAVVCAGAARWSTGGWGGRCQRSDQVAGGGVVPEPGEVKRGQGCAGSGW